VKIKHATQKISRTAKKGYQTPIIALDMHQSRLIVDDDSVKCININILKLK